MQDVLIVGTSNTVLKGGWSDGFREAWLALYPEAKVDKKALGGAPFSQFLADAENVISGKYRFILVDSSPNDEAYSGSVGYDWFAEQLYRDFISILSTKAQVIVLRIPLKKTISKLEGFAFVQKAICDNLGASYFDASHDIIEISANMSEAPYRDMYHPATKVSFQLGLRVAAYAQDLAPTEKNNRRGIGKYSADPIKFGTSEVVSIENSLLKCSASIVTDKAQYRLKTPSFCFGMLIVTQRTNAVVRLTSPNSTHFDIHCFFRGVPNVGAVQFVPFPNGYFLSSIGVVRPWNSYKSALHTIPPEPPYELGLVSLLCHIKRPGDLDLSHP